jgi:ABC-2 type transport system permease protein
MYSLVLKDLLIQKKLFRFLLMYGIFILIAFNNEVFTDVTYVMGAVAGAYMLLHGACAYESKGSGEMVLNSFPISREEIVRSRYLSVFVFTLLSLAIIGLLGAVMKLCGLPFPLRYVNWFDLAVVLISMLIMASIYLPLFFKYGYIQSRVFNVIMFMLIFFAPSLLIEYYQKHSENAVLQQLTTFVQSSPFWLIGLAIGILFLLFYYASYRFSVLLYRNREF